MNFINNLKRDEFGRVSGIIEVYKPVGVTSHDVVEVFRRILATKKVGHIGTLDPLADADFHSDNYVLNKIYNFPFKYLQTVPVFSSVKIKGKKLYDIARSADHFLVKKIDESEILVTRSKDGIEKIYLLPVRPVEISQLKLLQISKKSISQILSKKNNQVMTVGSQVIKFMNTEELQKMEKQIQKLSIMSKNTLRQIEKKQNKDFFDKVFDCINISITVNSGFYIRKFAEDLCKFISPDLSGFAVSISRTKVNF